MKPRTVHNALVGSKPAHHRLYWSGLYFATIVVSNLLLVWLEPIEILGVVIPPAIILFGLVFVFRDYAQTDLGHSVLAVMLAAALATYWLAGPDIAFVSVFAFLVSELVDYVVFSITKRPFLQRMLLSSLISVPVDTAVLFYLLNILDAKTLAVGVAVKMIGTMAVWSYLMWKQTAKAQPA
ncbi:VUT family protein [Shinella sp. JR1-6]|uniref:VUT family protein n=1 Tax=Shinella sp. JR1-6 TaxID=2527671 RepID=UPI001405427A|nr:VUT family protein [Shinella sp. JR1-6]